MNLKGNTRATKKFVDIANQCVIDI